jgi:hypothetical protein
MLTFNASSCSAEVERTVSSIFCCTLAGNTPKFITYAEEIFIGVQILQNLSIPGTPSFHVTEGSSRKRKTTNTHSTERSTVLSRWS